MAFTSRHDDSPQHRNISSNTKQFNVQIECLMFCKTIRKNLRQQGGFPNRFFGTRNWAYLKAGMQKFRVIGGHDVGLLL